MTAGTNKDVRTDPHNNFGRLVSAIQIRGGADYAHQIKLILTKSLDIPEALQGI